MRVAFAISAIPARMSLVSELAKALPDPRIYIDDPLSGTSWTNYRRALDDAGRDGEDWIVSLDDDARVSDGFAETLPGILAQCPGPFANLYWSSALPDLGGASWYRHTRVVHGIAWAARVELAADLIAYGEAAIVDGWDSGDHRLLAWACLAPGASVCTLVPGVVEHRQDPELVSTMRRYVGRPNVGRKARRFAPDARALEWNGRVVDAPPDTYTPMAAMAQQGALSERALAMVTAAARPIEPARRVGA